MQRGSKLLQTISAKLSERYIQTLHDKVKNYIKKDVFLLKFEHLLIIKQYPATFDFSNSRFLEQIAFPLEVREIGIPLYTLW